MYVSRVFRDFAQFIRLRKRQRFSLDVLPLGLFDVRDMVSYLRHLESLRFRGCIDELDELGMALIKAKASIDYYLMVPAWRSLMEKYRSKVNGAGVACLCRRQSCFLTTRGSHGWECELLLG